MVTLECREYDRPRHWRFVNGGQLSVDFSVDLTPESGGTRFTSRFDATPHGFLRLVFPVFLVFMRREEAANMVYQEGGGGALTARSSRSAFNRDSANSLSTSECTVIPPPVPSR